MTDQRDPIDQAERVRRLQERRAASAKSPPTKSRGAGAGSRAAARRRHPAGASRIFLAGLSVASFFGIGGTMLLAGNNTASVATPAASTAVQQSTSATGTSATATTTAPAVSAATSAKSTAASAPVVHTKTKAS